MDKTTRALLFTAVLFALPAWANHHGHSGGGSGGDPTPVPEVCVAWALDDGGVTDAGQDETEQLPDGGTVVDVLPCVQKEPLGCSSATGTAMIGLGALAIALGRRRRE